MVARENRGERKWRERKEVFSPCVWLERKVKRKKRGEYFLVWLNEKVRRKKS